MNPRPFVAQVFGETDEHWLLKVGKRDTAQFELDEENVALNRFHIIFFQEPPPEVFDGS